MMQLNESEVETNMTTNNSDGNINVGARLYGNPFNNLC